jgi:hypothetical protein
VIQSSSVLVEIVFERAIRFIHAILQAADPSLSTFAPVDQIAAVSGFVNLILSQDHRSSMGAGTFEFIQLLTMTEMSFLINTLVAPSEETDTGLPSNAAVLSIRTEVLSLFFILLKACELQLGLCPLQSLEALFIQPAVIECASSKEILRAMLGFCLNQGFELPSSSPSTVLRSLHLSAVQLAFVQVMTEEQQVHVDLFNFLLDFVWKAVQSFDLALEALAREKFVRFLLSQYQFIMEDDTHPCQSPLFRLLECLAWFGEQIISFD